MSNYDKFLSKLKSLIEFGTIIRINTGLNDESNQEYNVWTYTDKFHRVESELKHQLIGDDYQFSITNNHYELNLRTELSLSISKGFDGNVIIYGFLVDHSDDNNNFNWNIDFEVIGRHQRFHFIGGTAIDQNKATPCMITFN